MDKEIWKEVRGWESFYQVSNLGRVRSFDRIVNCSNGVKKNRKGRIFKLCVTSAGYYVVPLRANGVNVNKLVHQLVAESFLNHIPNGWKLVVNHIDFNKLNNHVSNLEIITNRENTNQKHLNSSSQYVGVRWNKNGCNWRSDIRINGIKKSLGTFTNEYEAHLAYQHSLSSLK